MKALRMFSSIKIIPVIIFFLNCGFLWSQGTDAGKTYANRDKLCIGILVNPQFSGINNIGSSGFTITGKGAPSVNFGFEGGIWFSKYAGISFGAEMKSFTGSSSLDTYSASFMTTDSENESFEMRVSGKSITEKQKISFISVPLCVSLRVPAGNNIGFWIKAGTAINIPAAKTYKGSGTFTYEGYYDAYPVLLQDLPQYGFPTNLVTSSSGNLKIKSMCLALTASGGVSVYLNDILQLTLGADYFKSMGTISDYGSSANYKLSSAASVLNSLMGGTTSAGVHGFGLSLGFRYWMK